MEPKLTIIQTPTQVAGLINSLDGIDLIAYDSETTGLLKSSEVIGISICFSEDEAFYLILAYWDRHRGALEYLPGMKDAAIRLLQVLKTKSLIMHNGTFDCMMAEAFFKISLIDSLHSDTMIMAHLLNENRRVGLKELGADLFGQDAKAEAEAMKASVVANGGSITKGDYQMYKASKELMAKYGAKDAWLTYKIFLALVPELYEQELDKFFYEDESMPLLRGPTYELNTTGLQIDTKGLTSLKKTLQAECLEAKDFIHKEIHQHIKDQYPGTNKKNTFNIGSSSQLSWLLFGKLELEFSTLTKEGKVVCKDLLGRLPYTYSVKRDFIYQCQQAKGMLYAPAGIVNGKKTNGKKYKDPWSYIACDKKTLAKFAPKYKWIEKLLEYNRKMKILSTYLEGIEERIQYGIIQPSFLQHGTSSGRYASRNPNFQNLPRDDKRVKGLVTARPGKVFVGADYSQLEPRVFAYFSGDERLLASFRSADDFYSVIGIHVYGKTDALPIKEGHPDAFGVKYKKLRDLSKVIALASTYGASAHQLSATTGKSVEATQEDIDNYFEQFPGVKEMMLESHEMAKKQGFVTNLFGRKRRIPEALKIDKIYGKKAHADYPYEVRSLLNLGVNHRIQSTGASIVNRAAIRFHSNCKLAAIDCKLVAQVHDSLVVECAEVDAENVLALLQDAMENTTVLPGVVLEAIPKIGLNLAEV